MTSRTKIPLNLIFWNHFSRVVLTVFGLINDFFDVLPVKRETNRESYVRLFAPTTTFFIRHFMRRWGDTYGHVLASTPAPLTTIHERALYRSGTEKRYSGRQRELINFGSYNYLGFAQSTGPITEDVERTIRELGVGVGSPANELGRHRLYCDLESSLAAFLGVEDSLVFGMGFATNSVTIPALFGKGCLVVSDERNHASLIEGCRLSGATTRVFKHMDVQHLERIVRHAIVEGDLVSGKGWRKVIIIVEGIYSMEGTVVDLPTVLSIRDKYKTYLYIDEAHSIGAFGPRGRGVCDHFGVDPKHVDVLMGTFTKSFAASGGYVAGSRHLVEHLRGNSAAFHYANPISAPIVRQILSVIAELSDTEEGMQRIHRLRELSVRVRQTLKGLGFHVDGHQESPVVIVKVYADSTLICLVKELLRAGIGVVGVTFPIIGPMDGKVRLCLCSEHSPAMIEHLMTTFDRLGDCLGIKYNERK